jgi:hypothetical protein
MCKLKIYIYIYFLNLKCLFSAIEYMCGSVDLNIACESIRGYIKKFR